MSLSVSIKSIQDIMRKDAGVEDLEWMKRVGIGGAHMADIGGTGGGQMIENPLTFFTPEWFDTVKHAAAECNRLGLEMTIFSSSGWSLTGGPWVKPEQAMKKLVWSESNVQGPAKISEKLPQPPSNTGSFGGLRGLNSGRGGAASQIPVCLAQSPSLSGLLIRVGTEPRG